MVPLSNVVFFPIMDKRRLKISSQVCIDTSEYSLLSGIVITSLYGTLDNWEEHDVAGFDTGSTTVFRISNSVSYL